ncbi:unnamed protein product [Lactuca saligna]|uniref:Eukaryotic translation initiation factor 5B n=1 Tax=Lactuca saligna TaxID=75948 RepID=A0AA36A354_LACSI|nr:unnamed protein product [Lactuca saligna]
MEEQGSNTELYNKNKDRGETYSIVPTSAISGEGIPEMLLLLVQWAQKTMIEKLTYNSDIQCTVLEVKVIEDLGTIIDVVLVNGVLHEGDEIVVYGFQGSIHTTIRSLLTSHLMKELRVKTQDGGDVKGEVSPRDIVYTQAAGGEEDPNIFHMLDLRYE